MSCKMHFICIKTLSSLITKIRICVHMFHFVCNGKLLFDLLTELFSRVIHSLDLSIHQTLREIHMEENSRNFDREMC